MENTSQIATIAYKIETWKYQGFSLEEIKEEIKDLQDNDKFPENLQLIDAYLGEEGTSGCAFLDINTGEVVVGFAGTNKEPGDSEFGKDVAADITIGVNGLTPDGEYLKEANEFIKGLEDYNVTQLLAFIEDVIFI